MKKVIRCKSCSTCAREVPPGFLSLPRLYCTDRLCYVEPDDGCTFGEPGKPMTACPDIGATIDGHSAVWGCCDQD